ncbi:MAG: hypothetical protein M1414_02390 [Candidatus Thermoplasmatota archaeon]|jgi:hypothetical protein|nr:hypothetical protein [Candidatus Thermoplasmatota archaeon]MCL5987736.1 hypothetical protein [Candidatus Thermoplasmatota archaeon]
MSSLFGGLLSSLTSYFNTYLLYMEQDPLVSLRFTIPLGIVFVYGLMLRSQSNRAKVDSNPVLAQEREQFAIPVDYLNKEMIYVTNQDVDHIVEIMEKSTRNIKMLSLIIKRNNSRYKRLKYRMKYTQSSKRKAKLQKRMDICTGDILGAYGEIRRITINVEKEE